MQPVSIESFCHLILRTKRIQWKEKKRKPVAHTEIILTSHKWLKKLYPLLCTSWMTQCYQLLSSGIDWGDGRVNANMVLNKNHCNEEVLGKKTRNIFLWNHLYRRQTPAQSIFDCGLGSHTLLSQVDNPIVAQNVAWWQRVFFAYRSLSLPPSLRHQLARNLWLPHLDRWNNYRS